ncbi:hypothetical protein [Microbacterium sp. 77mftsu3.1]|uniref:hypothetical protein n=1 Tax=Microbacterium sp. 77mftsu3.1 TaxID=1761802 RepID=UPI00037723D3|nr:hypothetical protein [Microbacterium sp. 77mftsu3.1]SDG26165.1 hypothetical protein SAMN04488590_0368 [Microbacterium sp. 77mftsu3.1]
MDTTDSGPADLAPDVEGPEDRGAPSAEAHYVVTEHDGVTRVDIADDAAFRPGPGQGQPEADAE